MNSLSRWWGTYIMLTVQNKHSLTEPPADSWQNSNKPSNLGQSSPTLTAKQQQRLGSAPSMSVKFKTRTKPTSLHLPAVLGRVAWSDGTQEFDVVIAVILCHVLCCGFVRTLKCR